ncbi:MAG: hypothetical protein KDA37_14030 [Planctomycetales bacterium]|nr:hypothetical protein [Planctomycetales bacterium]
MRFELRLFHEGLISAEQLVSALERQIEQMPKLGQVAIEEGLLTVSELFSVLRVQADLPQERFGETAVELNLLTREEVAALLLLQSDRKRPLHEILIEQGAIPAEIVHSRLEAFKRGMENGGPDRRRVSRSSFVFSHSPATAPEPQLARAQ